MSKGQQIQSIGDAANMGRASAEVSRSAKLLELSRELASTISLEPLLHRIVAEAASLLSTQTASILLLNDAGDLRFVAASNRVGELANLPVPLEGSIAGAAVSTREPQIIADAGADPRHYQAVNQATNRKTVELLAVPILYRGRCIGALEAENKVSGTGFSKDDVETLTLLGAHAAVAIENARMVEALRESRDELELRVEERTAELSAANAALLNEIAERRRAEEAVRHMAYHDALTGLPNRILFHDRLQQAMALATRNRRTAALLMLDIDHFKSINDTFGHDVGDALLTSVAKRLRQLVRESDTVARMGGDEFTVILPEAARLDHATEVARKIVLAFEMPFELDGKQRQVTTSVGVAMFPADGEDADTLMKSADVAMYRAKHAGRNAFHCF